LGNVAFRRESCAQAGFEQVYMPKGRQMPLPPDRTLTAFGLIMIYAVVIGLADNYVRVVAAESGLWQFHAMRSSMAIPLIALIALVLRHRFVPRHWPSVLARSAIHGCAMLVYFGALAYLPVAIVAAGLFTAPLFVLLIARVLYSEPISALQIIAVLVGFGGVVLVLGPQALTGASLAALLPVIAGALYAMGNIATRRWCAAESAETLLAGFFGALLVLGLSGMLLLALFPQPIPGGTDGFIFRGLATPSGTVLMLTAMQAVVSVIGVGVMIRAYQIARAPTVSVFEYVILPMSAIWGLIIWNEVLTPLAMIGMGLIALAGALIAFAPAQPRPQSPTLSRQ
jgi:drug/metabolite transporter (DMT)-like permease